MRPGTAVGLALGPLASEPSRLGGRRAEALREERVLVRVMFLMLMALPIEAISGLRTVLYGAVIVLGLAFFVVDGALRGARRIDLALLALAGGFFAYLFACWLAGGGQGTERVIQAAAFLVVLLSYSRYPWQGDDMRWIKKVCVALLLVWTAMWLAMGRPMNYYSAWCGSGNGFAVLLFCYVAIALVSISRFSRMGVSDALILLASVLLMLLANSRSAMVATIVMVIAALVMRTPKSEGGLKRVAIVLFAMTLAAALAFTVIYPSLLGTSLGNDLNMLSREYLNKNFFSGRQEVWKQILYAIEGHELFGLGLSMTPSMIYATELSSHNLYLQTILQSGYVGLAFIVAVLWFVVSRLAENNSLVSRIGIAFVLGTMAHECLEVALTQNNIQVGLLCWAVMGIAFSLSSSRSEVDGDTP